ncbi:MAG TPA: hypothetical protein VHV30_10835, partial [Polyangiaceae bacterium]|nr:hypothetical protein [Polyangiaceae bacterium]
MTRKTLSGGVLGAMAASALVATTWTATSHAQETTVVQSNTTSAPAPVAAESRDAYTGPNRRLIGSGLVTFGVSYIPALIVAGTSDVSADHHLYVPIVGPWLDLGDRPECGAGHIGCDTETTNKVLLVVDGLFQGIGAVTTVWGFLTPEHREVTT